MVAHETDSNETKEVWPIYDGNYFASWRVQMEKQMKGKPHWYECVYSGETEHFTKKWKKLKDQITSVDVDGFTIAEAIDAKNKMAGYWNGTE